MHKSVSGHHKDIMTWLEKRILPPTEYTESQCQQHSLKSVYMHVCPSFSDGNCNYD